MQWQPVTRFAACSQTEVKTHEKYEDCQFSGDKEGLGNRVLMTLKDSEAHSRLHKPLIAFSHFFLI